MWTLRLAICWHRLETRLWLENSSRMQAGLFVTSVSRLMNTFFDTHLYLHTFPKPNMTLRPFYKWGPQSSRTPQGGKLWYRSCSEGAPQNPYPALTRVCKVSVCLRSERHISRCNENQLKAHTTRLTLSDSGWPSLTTSPSSNPLRHLSPLHP